MKKITTALLALGLLCLHAHAQPITQPYHYPVQPGSAEWQKFTSVEDMYRACQLPPDILHRLTTRALIQTCLDYPARISLLTGNSPQQGFDQWKQHFNGITELFNRKDARVELLLFYGAFNPAGHAAFASDVEKGNYTFRLQMLEAMLAQTEITSHLSMVQQKNLLSLSLEKYKAKQGDPVYGFNSITYTGRIISQMSARLDGRFIQAKTLSDAQEFMRTGLLGNRQTLLDIVTGARKINTGQ